MSSLRELRKRDTRTRLYRTAVRLFRERGYDEVSVDQIAVAAGTAKGTFFNYFPTKEHVLAEYRDQMSNQILERVEDRRFDGCETAVVACFNACVDVAEKDRSLAGTVLRRMFSSPILMAVDLKSTQRFMDWIVEQVDAGIASGELKPDVDRETLVSMIVAVLSWTMNSWALGNAVDLREALQRRLAFVFDAARTRA